MNSYTKEPDLKLPLIIACTLAASLMLTCAMLLITNKWQGDIVQSNTQELHATQTELSSARKDIALLSEQVSKLKNEVSKLPKWISCGDFKITYYWIGEDEYNDTIASPCDGKHKAIAGHTIAVDTNIIPYGTRVMINNHIYTAEDCGGAVKGNVIDIYTTTPKDVTYNTEVFVLMK